MGTTLLNAVQTIGRIPDAYFQAIGSGNGTIAAWENNLRLIEDGRFGKHKMKLLPSQNAPFTIMYDSWKAQRRTLVALSAEEARYQAAIIQAKVLSNRKPPYSLAGGLFDALTDSNGDIYKIENREIDYWSAAFQYLEGIDINPAAAVAVASLAHAVEEGTVKRKDILMLNITGGGENLTKNHHNVVYAKPDLVLNPNDPEQEIIKKVEALFK
jgi:cysteate synthase